METLAVTFAEWADIPDRLRRHGISPTQQRVGIARVLFSRHTHVSADQILAKVNGGENDTSKATVYNTLRLFLEKGLIREVIVDPSKVFYDTNTQPHHHFFNVDTGELTDIPARDLIIDGLPLPPPGMRTDRIDVIVRIRPSAPSDTP